ncbi:MAG TPA: hypothetical protein VIY48_00450 [Candidatus Paceibacterota bacterium]
MIDLAQHEHVLRKFVAAKDICEHAMVRMKYGATKYERAVPRFDDSNRDFLAEALEEFIDGLNRLIMEINRNGELPLMHEVIFSALETIRGVQLLR